MQEGFSFNAPPTPEVNTESFHEKLVEEIDNNSRSLDEKTHARIKKIYEKHGRSLEDSKEQKALREKFTIKEKEGSVNGQDFHFLGVAHTPETLLFEREKLEDAIKNSGAVVLEGAPEIAGLLDPEFQKKIYEELMVVLKDKVKVDEWIKENITNHPFGTFFHEMEQLAKKYGKPVITIDPHSGPNSSKHLLREWMGNGDALQAKVGAIQMGMVGGWGAGAFTGLGFLALGSVEKQRERRAHRQKQEEQEPRDVVGVAENAPENPGRRKFLAGMAVLGVTAVVTPTVALSVFEQEPERAGGDKPLVASLLFDAIDYRNVAVARGIDRLTQQEKYQGPLAIIYGSYHTDTMINYLNSPTLRDLKYEAYAPLRDIKPPQIGEYRYVVDDTAPFNTNPTGRWERIRAEEV